MAWNVWSVGAVLAWVPLAMCGGQPKMADPPDTGALDTGEADDVPDLQEVADEAVEELLLELSVPDPYETVTLDGGCEAFKWRMLVPFGYDPQTLESWGTQLERVEEWEAPDPAAPWSFWLDMAEDGTYHPAGVGWYLTHFDLSPDAPETFLDLPVEDLPAEILAPSIPSQKMGHRINGWLWKTHADHTLDWFGGPNQSMQVPSWYSDEAMAEVWSTAWNRVWHGYPDSPGDCLQHPDGDIGLPVVKAEQVGLLDPERPDTVLLDHEGMILGVQWTAPDDGSGPPQLWGQTFRGPDADGNYVLRMWMGHIINMDGFFAETHAAFSCDEPFFEDPCWTGD